MTTTSHSHKSLTLYSQSSKYETQNFYPEASHGCIIAFKIGGFVLMADTLTSPSIGRSVTSHWHLIVVCLPQLVRFLMKHFLLTHIKSKNFLQNRGTVVDLPLNPSSLRLAKAFVSSPSIPDNWSAYYIFVSMVSRRFIRAPVSISQLRELNVGTSNVLASAPFSQPIS